MLDYWYEKTAKELMRKMLRLYGDTDWSMDDLYDLVKQMGELDSSKYTLVRGDSSLDIKVELSGKGMLGYK